MQPSIISYVYMQPQCSNFVIKAWQARGCVYREEFSNHIQALCSTYSRIKGSCSPLTFFKYAEEHRPIRQCIFYQLYVLQSLIARLGLSIHVAHLLYSILWCMWTSHSLSWFLPPTFFPLTSFTHTHDLSLSLSLTLSLSLSLSLSASLINTFLLLFRPVWRRNGHSFMLQKN